MESHINGWSPSGKINIFSEPKKPDTMPGGGGGSIASMISTLKNNALLIKKRKSLNEIDKLYGSKSGHVELNIRHTTPEELIAFNKKLVRERRRTNIIQALLIIVFASIAVAGAVLFIKHIVN